MRLSVWRAGPWALGGLLDYQLGVCAVRLSPSLICKAGCPPVTVRAPSSPGLMAH